MKLKIIALIHDQYFQDLINLLSIEFSLAQEHLHVIKDFLNQPFHLLDQKQNRLLLIVTIGIYTILFMNLYHPFNVNNLYRDETIPMFIILSGFGLFGTAVLMISQLVIREFLNIRAVRMYGIVLWFLVELMLLTVTMYFIYGNTSLKGGAMVNEFYLIFKYTVLVLIIPYAGVLFYLHTTRQGENIDTLLNASNHLVNILDENGQLHIAIDLEQLLFIKSADNYVAVYFLRDGKVRKELVRTTLKRLETELDEYPIRRCHRSYMVNINMIAVSMKNNQGLSLGLKNYSDEIIPVSKNYKAFFTRLIKQKEGQDN
ncbi:MAG: LytTR family transcriptional regulator [Cytophagales bacterium]|nr:LytTR family transcriptional regulator [Cytophagales bacterium]